MFSVAELLERAKSNARIESDYRLAKVLRINQSALSNYRSGRSLPNVEIVEALCALSGDDAGLMVAQVEAARAADGPVRNMWLSVAKRLAGGAQTAILSVLLAIVFVASSLMPPRAEAAVLQKLYSSTSYTSCEVALLSVGRFLLVRLRRYTGIFRFSLCFL